MSESNAAIPSQPAEDQVLERLRREFFESNADIHRPTQDEVDDLMKELLSKPEQFPALGDAQSAAFEQRARNLQQAATRNLLDVAAEINAFCERHMQNEPLASALATDRETAMDRVYHTVAAFSQNLENSRPHGDDRADLHIDRDKGTAVWQGDEAQVIPLGELAAYSAQTFGKWSMEEAKTLGSQIVGDIMAERLAVPGFEASRENGEFSLRRLSLGVPAGPALGANLKGESGAFVAVDKVLQQMKTAGSGGKVVYLQPRGRVKVNAGYRMSNTKLIGSMFEAFQVEEASTGGEILRLAAQQKTSFSAQYYEGFKQPSNPGKLPGY